MSNQSFDNLVKQKASEHEATVPSGVWEAIVKEKKKKRYPAFWWVTGGAALVLIAISFSLLHTSAGNKDSIADQQTGITRKPTEYPKEESTETSSNIVKDANPVSPDNIENKNLSSPLSLQTPVASDVTNTAVNESPVISAKKLNQTSSLSISTSIKTSKENKLLRTISKQNTPSTSPDFNTPVTTAIAGSKQAAAEKNNGVDLSEYAATNITISPVSISTGENAGTDLIGSENKLPMMGRNGHSLLTKQWNDLSLNHPAVAYSMVSPAPATIGMIRIKPTRWSMDISMTPFQPIQQKQSLESLSRTTTSGMHNTEYKPDQITTVLKPALAYGISINKKITKKITAGAGLQYAVIKEHITLNGKETNTSYEVVQRLDNSGPTPVLVNDTVTAITTGTRTINAINSYRLLEIPILIQYTVIEKPFWSLRLNGGVQLGISARYHNSISGKLIPEYFAGHHPQNGTAMRLGFLAGMRFTNRLTSKYQLFAAPYLRFSTGSYGVSTLINNRPIHQAGISLGLSYKVGN
jgi:hypothetical protein